MHEILCEENVKQFTKLLYDITKTIGGTLWDLISRKGKDVNNYLYKISSKYLHRFYQRHGHIQVLGMSEPMSLSHVFVDIRVLDSLTTHKYLSLEKLRESFEKSSSEIRSLNNQDINKLDGIKIIEQESRLMVVGAPGGGKTTYLRRIGIESLSSTNKVLNSFMPILIELKNIDIETNVYTLMLRELEVAEFPNPKEFLEKALEKGKLIILFDGLDEVPTELENATLREIKDFCDQHNKNKFIVSCRLAAYKGGLTNFKNFEIANLDKAQIEEFIKKWFKEKSKGNKSKDVSTQCWEIMKSSENTATIELAQSPLLLTLLCLVFNYQQDFPKNRSLLYREAINILLKEWNAEKRIHSNTVYKDMTLPFEELLLSQIAHHYFIKNEYFFDKAELSSFISGYISENLNAPKFLDGSKILEAISIQQGILVERAKNVYSFSHLTFQEYFKAKYIDDHNISDSYIKKYLFNPKWREIFILLCGIMKSGSDKLLNEILEKVTSDIKDEESFQYILVSINKFDPNKTVDIRLINLLLTLLFGTNFTFVGNYNIILLLLKEVNAMLFNVVSDSWIVDIKPHLELHYKLYLVLLKELRPLSNIASMLEKNLLGFKDHNSLKILKKDFCRDLNIGSIDLSEALKRKVINEYLSNLFFLYQCKKSSILVTKSNWQNIEANIITPNVALLQ